MLHVTDLIVNFALVRQRKILLLKPNKRKGKEHGTTEESAKGKRACAHQKA
ncbi:hypothetical protein PRABACTJOHN_03599 [Parabacteroides johnsonii DSM 18315]|uniref:Uncharacterized protein n=1 Tax=Parabacteroides johnsonii DSM 18315 TaxID=537006 RepID=B7BEX0_9BACT|nr:hypothetical protein PRABACTJOHN_03599 [Parabacteroides johnsonii DSM 18315]